MSDTLSKVVSIFFYVLVAISVVLVVVFYMAASNLAADATHAMQIDQLGNVLEYFIIWAYLLLAIASIASIVFPLINLFTDLKSATKALIYLVAIGAVIFIAYSLGSDEIMTLPGYDGTDNVPSRLLFADTTLFTMYFLMIAGVGGMLYAEVAKIFK